MLCQPHISLRISLQLPRAKLYHNIEKPFSLSLLCTNKIGVHWTQSTSSAKNELVHGPAAQADTGHLLWHSPTRHYHYN